MILPNNLKTYIINSLIEDGYYALSEVPYSSFIEKLKLYLNTILNEPSENDLKVLIFKYLNFVPQNEQSKLMSELINFLLRYMSVIQGWEIIWQEEDTKTPEFRCSKYSYGALNSFVTPKYFDYLTTINYILENIENISENKGEFIIR